MRFHLENARRFVPRLQESLQRTRFGLRSSLGLVIGFIVLVVISQNTSSSITSVSAQDEDRPILKYELIDTWEKEPWELTAGRFGRVGDISSDSLGETFVLDTRHNAMHVMDVLGDPLRVYYLPDSEDLTILRWKPLRLDVGFDDKPYVLYEGLYIDPETNRAIKRFRVDRLSADGEILHSFTFEPGEFPEPREGGYFDIALRPDGRIYLARSAVNAFIQFRGCEPAPGEAEIRDSGIDIFSPEGEYLETIDFYTHGSIPFGLDIDSTSEIYVINLIPGVLYNPNCTPQPTNEPSFEEGILAQDQDEGRWETGIAIFEPDHELREIVEFFNAEDIAVGPSGVFVSRHVEIFQLRDDTPMYVGPSGQVYAAYFGDIVFHLDATFLSTVQAGMTHCYWMGVMLFDNPNRRPDIPIFGGSTDAPELEGPAYPRRVAADDELGRAPRALFGHGRSGPESNLSSHIAGRPAPDGSALATLCQQASHSFAAAIPNRALRGWPKLVYPRCRGR